VKKRVKVTEVFRVLGASDLDQLTDDVLDHLVGMEGDALRDADVSVSLLSGIVEISIVSVAVDYDEAVEEGSAAIAQAILASGGRQQLVSATGVGFDKQGERSDLLVQA